MNNDNDHVTYKGSHQKPEERSEINAENRRDLNPDPITGEPGSHPVGTGIGAAGGAATGVAVGTIGGPIGMAVGGVVGAIAGGLAGHAIAEGIDPTAEDAYWNENYRDEPYFDEDYDYADYEPAYRMGYRSYRGPQSSFDDTEPDLARDWESNRGESRLGWDHARHAARASWDRVHRASPGDGDDVTRGDDAVISAGRNLRDDEEKRR